MAKIIQVARFTADGTNVERTFKGMGDAGDRSFDRIKQGARSIPPAMRAVDASVGVAKQKVDGLAGSTGSLGTVLTSLGPIGIAAAAAVGGIALAFGALQQKAHEAVRAIGSIDGAAQQLGISIEAVQEFRFAMASIGEEATNADAALLAFSKALGQLNTETGKRALGALRELGFTEQDIARMTSVEVALPLIADRIRDLGTASEQAAVAQKLGLEPMLELLQQGSEGFERAAQEAREFGVIIDESVVRRAAEVEDQWKKAATAIDINLKSIFVELGPFFADITTDIANATAELTEFLRNLGLLRANNGGRAGIEAQLAANQAEVAAMLQGLSQADQDMLFARAGRDDASGDALRIQQLTRQNMRLRRELAALGPEASGRPPGGGDGDRTRTGPDPHAQSRAWIETLQDEQRARQDLLRITSEHVGISRQEAEGIRALERDLARLNELRAAGVIQSDEELRALSAIVQLRHDDAEATRRQAEALRVKQSLSQAIDRQNQNVGAFEQAAETPRERMLRDIAAAEAKRGQGASNESVDRTIFNITRAYEDMAAAQIRSSEAGWALEAALRGQIRSVEDLEDVLITMAQNYLIEQFFRSLANATNGGGQQSDGGFSWGGFFNSFFSSFTGGSGGGSAGGRAGGGPTYSGARHPYAEQGPELTVVGGWGQVLPNGTFEAIASLARTVQRAQQTPAPAMAGSAPIKVEVINQAGVEVNVEERQADGMRKIEIMVTRKTGADIANGEHDAAMRGRFGARPPRTRRG